MKFKYLTAPFYSRLLPSEILQMEINETKATCDSCLMARAPTPQKERYQDQLKCCTYYPLIPNFAAGAVLSDKRYGHAQEVLRDLIRRRQYALPIGLVAPVRYQLEFKERKAGQFGQVEEWLCPYFQRDANQCSLWAYRGAVCTSFYCQSSYRRKGQEYWARVTDYLTYLEMALLEEALIRLDFSPRQISACLDYLNREEGTVAEKKSWVLSEKTARLFWRDYFADQEGFYIKSYEIVSGFDKSYYKEMMGEQGLQVEKSLLAAYSRLTPGG